MTTTPSAPEGQTARHPTLLDWRGPALQAQLAALLPGLVVEVVAEVGSTNTALVERIRRHAQADAHAQPDSPPAGGALQPVLLVAEQQTQGRGRQGKTWHSSAGASVTLSLALPLAPLEWSGLSLAVGLCLAEALDPPGSHAGLPSAPRLRIKWPNDLLLATPADAAGPGRKLGGILIETVPVGRQRMAVVGVGLNLQPQPVHGPLNWGQACVQELLPELDAPGLLACMAPALLQGVLDFERAGFAPLVARYAQRDALHGRWVSTTLPEVPQGQADGVDAQGMLWLRLGGQRLPVGSGEVSLRDAGPAAGAQARAPAGHPR